MPQGGDCESERAHEEMHLIRDMVRSAWLAQSENPFWQTCFRYLCKEYAQEELLKTSPEDSKQMRTPPKGAKAAEDQLNQDEPISKLLTPPRPERKAIPQAGDGKPVPLTKRSFPDSPALMAPGPKKKGKINKLVEPLCPDIQEAHDDMEMAVDVNDVNVENVDQDMMESDEDNRRTARRATHQRRFKSRCKTDRELQMEDLWATWPLRRLPTTASWRTTAKIVL